MGVSYMVYSLDKGIDSRYHRQSCRVGKQILSPNRRFGGAADLEGRGYRPCPICEANRLVKGVGRPARPATDCTKKPGDGKRIPK